MTSTHELGGRTPVTYDDPWNWLGAGWRDLSRAPALSLGYGALFTLISAGISLGLFQTGLHYLILPLAAGFMLVGPMLAIGLYETSRRLEVGEAVSLGAVLSSCKVCLPRVGWMGAGLMMFFFAWMQIAALLFMLFFGGSHYPAEPEHLFSVLFYTPRGIMFLSVGTLIGAILAFVVFAISAVSVPMLVERDIDIVGAAQISINAVRQNIRPMILWGLLIGLLTIAGIATAFVGLILTFPLIGHATWHAYRALVSEEGRPPAG
jgi:uncharacterized membrane protein